MGGARRWPTMNEGASVVEAAQWRIETALHDRYLDRATDNLEEAMTVEEAVAHEQPLSVGLCWQCGRTA